MEYNTTKIVTVCVKILDVMGELFIVDGFGGVLFRL